MTSAASLFIQITKFDSISLRVEETGYSSAQIAATLFQSSSAKRLDNENSLSDSESDLTVQGSIIKDISIAKADDKSPIPFSGPLESVLSVFNRIKSAHTTGSLQIGLFEKKLLIKI